MKILVDTNSVLDILDVPDYADKKILDSRETLIEEGKDVACILKDKNVMAIIGYRQLAEND